MSETEAGPEWPIPEFASDAGGGDLADFLGDEALDADEFAALEQESRFADADGLAAQVDEDGMASEEAMREALKAVMDPEIGINVVDLGMVYGLAKDAEQDHVHVTMTLTSMGCPLAEEIQQEVKSILPRLPGVEHVEVEFTFTPPWTTEMISDEARDELRAMGFTV